MNRLREIRARKGVTQFDLAKIIDVHPQRISEFEHGKVDLRFGEMIKAAEYLGCTLEELAGNGKKDEHKKSPKQRDAEGE